MIQIRKCAPCGAEKPLSEFPKCKGKPLGHGYTCKSCRKAMNKAYYAANKESLYAKHLEWCRSNKEIKNAYERKRRRKNPEHVRAVDNARRQRNVERARAHARASYARNKQAYIQRTLAHLHRRRAAEGEYSPQDISWLHLKQRGKCAICKDDLNGKFHIDHVVPLAAGGTNWKENLQLACPPCNQSKGAKDPVLFMQSLGYLI